MNCLRVWAILLSTCCYMSVAPGSPNQTHPLRFEIACLKLPLSWPVRLSAYSTKCDNSSFLTNVCKFFQPIQLQLLYPPRRSLQNNVNGGMTSSEFIFSNSQPFSQFSKKEHCFLSKTCLEYLSMYFVCVVSLSHNDHIAVS